MNRTQFGTLIPQGWRLDLPQNLSPDRQYDLIAELTTRAEKLGFDSGWLFDHLHTYPIATMDSSFECWTLLSALSTETKKLRLGEMVTCNSYRHPSLLAKMSATFDAFSKGRLEFGLGAGWYEEEYKSYGFPFSAPKTRLEMLEEGIQIILRMWQEEKTTFRGKHYAVEGAINSPKPLQKPYPPITVGGGGEKKTLRIAARFADRSNIGGIPTYEEYARKFQILDEHCGETGRTGAVEKTFLKDVIVAEDEQSLKKALQSSLVKRQYDAMQDFAEKQIAGTPDKVIKELKKYKALGITYFIIYFPNAAELDPLDIFMKKVAPSLR